MVGHIRRAFPGTLLVVVGFSLGGNIVCKFLGESRSNQDRVLCCVSVCQGYSALRWVERSMKHLRVFEPVLKQCVCVCARRAQETFLQWDQFRRIYNFVLADKMKKLILSHR